MFYLASISALFIASTASAQSIDPGLDIYNYYCATCHGTGAEGNGPFAKYLTVKVADLTYLSERNGGEFPMLKVIHRLDGSEGEFMHDSPMPIFANTSWDEMADGYQDETAILMETRARILSIALYLETLQR